MLALTVSLLGPGCSTVLVPTHTAEATALPLSIVLAGFISWGSPGTVDLELTGLPGMWLDGVGVASEGGGCDQSVAMTVVRADDHASGPPARHFWDLWVPDELDAILLPFALAQARVRVRAILPDSVAAVIATRATFFARWRLTEGAPPQCTALPWPEASASQSRYERTADESPLPSACPSRH